MLSYTKRKNPQGFTLIEILIVIAIIGTLTTVVLSSMNGAKESARDTQRKAEINQAGKAMSLYQENNTGDFPDDWSELVNSKSMDQAPTDPIGGGHYGFVADGANYDICLVACMESETPDDTASSTCSSETGYNVGTSTRVDSDGTCSSGNPYYIAM